MTEDEARLKWCPFARVAWRDHGGQVAAVNRGDTFGRGEGRNPPEARCIGAECMAWQSHGFLGQTFLWSEDGFSRAEAGSPGVYEIVEPGSPGFVRVRQAKRAGECGLAAGAA